MKYLSLLTPLLAIFILSACAGDPEPKQTGEEFTLRAATPGVVDHVIIKPKAKK